MSKQNKLGIEPKVVQWHPAFASGIIQKYLDHKDDIRIDDELQLSALPVRPDMILTKLRDFVLTDPVGEFYRIYNLHQFKSLNTSYNTAILSQDLAYAYQLKASMVRKKISIPLTEITITVLRWNRPIGLMRELKEFKDVSISNPHPGIYRIHGFFVPIQIVNCRELDPVEYPWLTLLHPGLSREEMKRSIMLMNDIPLDDLYQLSLANTMQDAIIQSNRKLFLQMMKEDPDMPQFVRDYFHVDELEANLASIQEDYASLQESNNSLQKKYDSLQADNDALQADNTRLKAIIAAMEAAR